MVFVRAAGRHYGERRGPGAGACAGEKAAPHQSAQVENPDTAADRELASESEAAAARERSIQAFEGGGLDVPSCLGSSAEAGYWVFVFINFAIVAGFIYWASRTSLAQAFRNRTAAIQKGIEEARRASTEANARLRADPGASEQARFRGGRNTGRG